MKVEKMENFQNKTVLKGCKWSSLNAPGTENPLSQLFLGMDELPFNFQFSVRARLQGFEKSRSFHRSFAWHLHCQCSSNFTNMNIQFT